MRRCLLFSVVALVLSCASSRVPVSAPASEWQSPLLRDHPLVGRLWSPATGTWTDFSTWMQQAQAAQLVLLGEKHDNPDHHRLQAQVLAALVDRGVRPAVALEMLEVDQQPAVDTYLANPARSAAGFGPALEWDKSGWPPWPLYQPILEVALQAGLPVRAANLQHAAARTLVKSGRGVLSDEAWAELGLDHELDAPQQDSLLQELRDSHCGQLPESLLPAMALAQRARDATMAQRLLQVPPPVVLIAGTGHVRADRGVPWYVRAQRPEASVVTLAFVEVEAGHVNPADYVEARGGTLPFDAVWFTPRLEDTDPCVAFAKRKAR